tara:strand:- start:1304 stop:1834 length:531 start_codon:yes stop_codon:yes gene_type:complete
MNRLISVSPFRMLMILTSLTALFACTKTNYEDIQIVQELTDPEIVYLMDCEELEQNIGDTCHVESNQFGYVMGFVTDECECDAETNGEQITIAFESDLWWSSLVSVQTSPMFIAGPTSFEIGPGLTLKQFLFEEGTTECAISISHTCGPSGLLFLPEIILTGTPINGVVGPLEIDC